MCSCGQHDSSEFENQTYSRKPTCAVCYQMGMVTTPCRPFSRPRRVPCASTGVRVGGVTGRVAGGHVDRRTQRKAHGVRQRDLGARPRRQATGASPYPWGQGRVIAGIHRRRRPAVRCGAADRGRRQAARIVVAVARRGWGSRRGAGAARWHRRGPHRACGGGHRGRRETNAFRGERRRGQATANAAEGQQDIGGTALRLSGAVLGSRPRTRPPASAGCRRAAGLDAATRRRVGRGRLRREPRWHLRRHVMA